MFFDARLAKKDIIMFILTATSREEMVEIIQEAMLALRDKMPTPTQPNESSNDILTIEEAALFLKITKATVHNWRKEGRITASKLGGRVYFSKLQLLSQIKSPTKQKKNVL